MDKLKLDQLKGILKAAGIRGYSKLRKQECIDLINEKKIQNIDFVNTNIEEKVVEKQKLLKKQKSLKRKFLKNRNCQNKCC